MKILNQYLYSLAEIPFGEDAQAYTNPRSLQCFHWLYYVIEIYSVESVPKFCQEFYWLWKSSVDKGSIYCHVREADDLHAKIIDLSILLSVYNLSSYLMHGYS